MNNFFSENIAWSIGIIVILFGIIAAHRLFIYRDKQTRIKEATKMFTIVFSEFIHILQNKGALFPDAKIKEIIKQHETAAINLRASLKGLEIRRFNRYWKQYRKKADQYYNAPAQLGYPKTNKEMLKVIDKFIKRVKRI